MHFFFIIKYNRVQINKTFLFESNQTVIVLKHSSFLPSCGHLCLLNNCSLAVCFMSSLGFIIRFCLQSLQRSAWHHPVLTLKLVRMPWCSVPRRTTHLWTLPLSGPWTATSSICTQTASTTSEELWDITLTESQKHTVCDSAAIFWLRPGVCPHCVIIGALCSGWSGHFWGCVILWYFGWNTWSGKVQPVSNDWP